MKYYLAIDMGATTGRHILAHLEDGKIVTEEIYRFRTYSKRRNDSWIWECDDLVEKVLEGLMECKKQGKIPSTMGISTWGADFVLLDKQGNLLGDAISYRDEMAMVNMLFEADNIMSPEDYFCRTGIGRMPFDSIYQLMAIQRAFPDVLPKTGTFLMLPSYIIYRLTGKITAEYTSCVTTGLMNSTTQTWDDETISLMDFPREIFIDIDDPGYIIGSLCEEVQEKLGFDTQVVLVPGHDTTSAFSAVPSKDPDSVTVSSGTWSLLGVVNDKPLSTREAMEAGFTNEGAYPKRYRLEKKIVGMFVLEKLRRELCPEASYEEIIEMAKSAEHIDSVIDLRNLMYLLAESMKEAIEKDCADSGQRIPETTEEFFQVFFHSLVVHYKRAIEELEEVTGRHFTSFNIIGGGSQNVYINTLAAKILGIPVYAGPTEATVTGNLICQLLATGELAGQAEGVALSAKSYPVDEYYHGIESLAGVNFRDFAQRLRREGIKDIIAMAYRLENGYALSTDDEAIELSLSDLEKKFPTFAGIFQNHADVMAIIQSAPEYCAEAAKNNTQIPPVLDDTAQIIGTKIQVCETENKPEIVDVLKKGNGCLLHDEVKPGFLAVGRNLERALACTLIAEKSVKAYEEAKLIGGAKKLSKPLAYLMHLIYEKSYSKVDETTAKVDANTVSYEISEEEMKLREAIVACGKKLRKHNLVQGTWGNIGVRLDEKHMLVTPSGLDYERLTPYEIVRVEIDTLKYEGNIRPTSEKALHALLLSSNPNARCVIHSHPVDCSIFAAARVALPILDESDRKLLGDNVPCSEPAIASTKKFGRMIDQEMGTDGTACIISNHGMVVRGTSIADAFDKCEALERSAGKYIKQRAEEVKAAAKAELGNREVFEGEIDTPVGRVLAQVLIDRTKDPLAGDFVAMNTTTPISEVAMTDDGFTGKTMFKAGFLKLPVDLNCHFAGDELNGKAETKMGDLEFSFTKKVETAADLSPRRGKIEPGARSF